jgi:hypothetical protein
MGGKTAVIPTRTVIVTVTDIELAKIAEDADVGIAFDRIDAEATSIARDRPILA